MATKNSSMFETLPFLWKSNIFDGKYVILKAGQCWLFTYAICTALCFVPRRMNFKSGDGVAACVNQWEVQNYVFARLSSIPSWTTMLILYFYQSLRKILNDFDNQVFFFANFYSNVILKRKKLVLTLKSTGKMFSIMIPTTRLVHVTVYCIQTKRKRSDSVLWQKPLHPRKCQKGSDNTNNVTKKFD